MVARRHVRLRPHGGRQRALIARWPRRRDQRSERTNRATAATSADASPVWRTWPPSGTTRRSNGPAHAGLDGVELGQRAVLVALALDREHRHVDPGEHVLDVPVAEGGGQPDVVPAPEHAVGVVVVAGQALPEPRRRVGRARGGDPGHGDVLDEDVGREQDQAGHGMPAPGVEHGDGATVAVPDEDGPLQPQPRQHLRQHLERLAVHVAHRPRPLPGGRASVAGAGVDEGRGSAGRGPHLVGERPPQLDRAESLVEEDERRPGVPRRPGLEPVVELLSVRVLGRRRADGERGHCRPPGVAAGRAVRPGRPAAPAARTAGSCRSPSSAARSGARPGGAA